MTSDSNSRRHSRELPTFYYHTHFLEMLEFVDKHYAHVLGEAEQEFRKAFDSLSFAAQCTYIRMLNRQGRVFARSRLRYAEIDDIDAALLELKGAAFLSSPDVSDIPELLRMLTRVQLAGALKSLGFSVKSTMKKAELVQLAHSDVPTEQLLAALPVEDVVVLGQCDSSGFLQFLYFGDVSEGLSRFTMRDLGIVNARESDDIYESRFADREDAVHAYFFADRLAQLRRHPEQATSLANEIDAWPAPMASFAADFRDQLALELGRGIEDNVSLALSVYEQGESVKCTERSIRLLLASGRRDEAQLYLERCIDSPSSDEEAMLAADIYARKFHKKRTSTLTDQLRSAKAIDIDESYRGAPERGVVDWYQRQGIQAYRVENRLWRTLFGLLFWDLLFESPSKGVHSPFDRLPSSLKERRFLSEHEGAIAERLEMLDQPTAAKSFLLRQSAAKFGKTNGVFRWRQSILDAMFALLDVAPIGALRQIMRHFCQDYSGQRHGYPDLMVIDKGQARFVEVKADGDQLRRNQWVRIEQLRSAGFEANLLRVRWVLHPEQAYVVVDVETTGGRGDQHRVTEIGAVRVVNGLIADRFHTLLNPQRHIPPSITRLTGITDDMVRDAPLFTDVAPAFSEFLQDAIFVAHNVEFDYRFIAQEFRRLGQPFRMAKLCTCASMRKLFPGHQSYGLAALCNAYDISLDEHHRALCDAEAAAQLLMLINEKRQALLSGD